MKKRFIVLIDFSEHSKHLLLLVNTWAKKVNAKVVLVHQVVNMVPGFGDTDVIKKMKHAHGETATDELRAFAAGVVGNDGTMRYMANTTHLISMIESLDEANTTDYLFVGLSDKSEVDRLFFGSTAAELSRELNKVILAFPTADTDISSDKLYVGVKERYPINDPVFRKLLGIMQGLISGIQFFTSIKPGEDKETTERYLQSLAARYGGEADTSYLVSIDKDPINTVKEYMVKNKGFLVIQKGSRNLADVFRKFWTTEMINTARIPIIILPNNN